MKNGYDLISKAILDYRSDGKERILQVSSDVSLPEEMPASYFFRGYEAMNDIERFAMDHAQGKVLDMGAGAGCHSLYLQAKGMEVHALESSPLLCALMQELGIEYVHQYRWQDWETNLKFDTILLLMNGAGMAEDQSGFTALLTFLKSLLSENGRIYMDSSDISYLFELEDGSMIMDLGGSGQGEIEYEIEYEGSRETFPWLFLGQEEMRELCEASGLDVKVVIELGESYLVEIKAPSPRTPSSSL